MFVRTTRTKGREYIKLVESYWKDGQSKQRLLFNFGRADLLRNDASFIRIVTRLCEIAEIPINSRSTESMNSIYEDCSEGVFYNYGYLAYLKLWRELRVDRVLKELLDSGSRAKYSVSEIVFLMAVQHLLEPKSKLGTFMHQNRYLNHQEIPLHQMYRSLDKLCEWKGDIEGRLFEHNYVWMKRKVDVVFYDVTTFAFESINADEFKDFGYSKDGKFKEVQVVMGMIIDCEGMPIGYELFPGNTFDGKTMLNALDNIKKRFGINRVIIVADRGINCKENLSSIKEAGYDYIVGSKIKGMTKAVQGKILSEEGFTSVCNDDGEEDFRYKVMPYTNVYKDGQNVKHFLDENLIISYSDKRARKDRKDRERLVEKALKLLAEPAKINASNKRGGKKFIDKVTPDQPETWQLAEEKIEHDAKFDGYYGIQSSDKNLSAFDIMAAYRTLWKIEESFRIMKTTMEVRPVFHWTPKRIKGHFVLCFLAFLLERQLECKLKELPNEVTDSPEKIQDALNGMQVVAVTTNNEELFINIKPDPLAAKIFKVLNINLPKNISKKDELADRLKIAGSKSHVQSSLF